MVVASSLLILFMLKGAVRYTIQQFRAAGLASMFVYGVSVPSTEQRIRDSPPPARGYLEHSFGGMLNGQSFLLILPAASERQV